MGGSGHSCVPIRLRRLVLGALLMIVVLVVTACGSGINACHNALAMRVAGLPDPLLYPGSYSDWSRAGLPVATGDEPGRYDPDANEPDAYEPGPDPA